VRADEEVVVHWDLGFVGLAALAGISLAFGLTGGLLVGGHRSRRWWAGLVTTVACFAVGLLTSEWLFGWATEEELQPNVDGLSRDEVLMSSVLTTGLIVLATRALVRTRVRRTPRSGARG
jgi:hypothetical protein